MRIRFYLIAAALLVRPFIPLEAANLSRPSAIQSPDVLAKTSHRPFSGSVQEIRPDGMIRLRDNRAGDIRVVITSETKISRGDHAAAVRDIRVGSRVHGDASFRGDKYFAKTLHLD